jgi:hypothetical protein
MEAVAAWTKLFGLGAIDIHESDAFSALNRRAVLPAINLP